MTNDFDAEAVIDAMAPMLGLDIHPDYRAGVATNLKLVAAMAALILEPSPGDHAEAAPVFTPEGLGG